MVIKTLIVDTMPLVDTMPRRPAEDTVTQEGGVLRARTSAQVTPPDWNAFQELDAEGRVHLRVRGHLQSEDDAELIPDGMEGSYYL